MHQPDSRLQNITILNHLKQKILIISIPVQNQWKVPWRDIDKQMGGHETSAISFHSSSFGKLVLLFSDTETLFFSQCLCAPVAVNFLWSIECCCMYKGMALDIKYMWMFFGLNLYVFYFTRFHYASYGLLSDEFPPYMQECLQQDYQGRFYEDFYRWILCLHAYDTQWEFLHVWPVQIKHCVSINVRCLLWRFFNLILKTIHNLRSTWTSSFGNFISQEKFKCQILCLNSNVLA